MKLDIDNKKYFNYSMSNPDEILDFSNPEGILVVSRNEREPQTLLMQKNDQLIDFITTYQTLRDDSNIDERTINHVVDQIIVILESVNLINYSPFCAYFQVLRFSYSSYMAKADTTPYDQKVKLIRRILDSYIEYRHDTYKYLGYSNIVLQMMSDIATSRRKGVEGIKKITEYLQANNFALVHDVISFDKHKYCYLLPDKGDRGLFNDILIRLGVEFKFRAARQNKMPDVMIKIGNDIFVVEQKITNGEGGSQNEAINEIIDFIKQDEESTIAIHYVSCLQGDYFETLANNKNSRVRNKGSKQYDDIINALTTYTRNCFVNENGLEKLINEAVDYYNRLD